MTKLDAFAIWAPAESPWSRWAKPVLFAHLDQVGQAEPPPPAEPPGWMETAPDPQAHFVAVLDLPGAEGVTAGLALARRGYRPVPLYNALPRPTPHNPGPTGSAAPRAAVDMTPVLAALRAGSAELGALNLPAGAPPVFLLDSRRGGDGRKLSPGEFDNRSVSLTTDFPSANFLLAHGLTRAFVVKTDTGPESDLAHTLRRWREGGLTLHRPGPPPSHQLEAMPVPRPRWFGAMFQRFLARWNFTRRHGQEGYGDWVPDQAAGG